MGHSEVPTTHVTHCTLNPIERMTMTHGLRFYF